MCEDLDLTCTLKGGTVAVQIGIAQFAKVSVFRFLV